MKTAYQCNKCSEFFHKNCKKESMKEPSCRKLHQINFEEKHYEGEVKGKWSSDNQRKKSFFSKKSLYLPKEDDVSMCIFEHSLGIAQIDYVNETQRYLFLFYSVWETIRKFYSHNNILTIEAGSSVFRIEFLNETVTNQAFEFLLNHTQKKK